MKSIAYLLSVLVSFSVQAVEVYSPTQASETSLASSELKTSIPHTYSSYREYKRYRDTHYYPYRDSTYQNSGHRTSSVSNPSLYSALSKYVRIQNEGGWPAVPDGRPLELGSRGSRVIALRQRLAAEGIITNSEDLNSRYFDETLSEQVKQFQRRHGLPEDGQVGPYTLKELNVPAENRVQQISMNLASLGSQPRSHSRRYISVNIATYELDVIENGRSIFNSKVIVGRKYRRTPVFSGLITHLILNPYWEVPHRIAVQDKLPEIKQDPSYLATHNFRVYRMTGDGMVRVNPNSVPWDRLSSGYFPYHLQQKPGPSNALGRVKFLFPNRYNVYLHDTPHKELFNSAVRNYSSGCIRVQRALDLAELVLMANGGWSRDRIDSVVESGQETRVDLVQPIPVHIQYKTVWVDEQGAVNFRSDLGEEDDKIDS